jgi:hypothetical protein
LRHSSSNSGQQGCNPAEVAAAEIRHAHGWWLIA